MAICVVCGKENDSYLCDECKEKTDIEQLCMDIIKYNANNSYYDNPIWRQIWYKLNDPDENFKNIAFTLSYELDPPKSEYINY